MDIKELSKLQEAALAKKVKEDDKLAKRLEKIGPKELTPQLLQDFIEALQENSEDIACARVGLNPTKYRMWMRQGAADIDLLTPYGTFYIAVLVAKGKIEADMMKKLKESRDWKAQHTIMSTLLPEQWGRALEATQADKPKISLTPALLSELSKSQLQKLSEGADVETVLTPDQLRKVGVELEEPVDVPVKELPDAK